MRDLNGTNEQSDMTSLPGDLPLCDGMCSKSGHKSIPGAWPESDDESKLIAELENLQRVCHKLSQKLEKNEEDAKESREHQICSEERVRRHGKLLAEARQSADTALKENRELVNKLAKLQRWTGCFDDEEAGQTMRKLYQVLQNWIRRHYSCAPSGGPAMLPEFGKPARPVNCQTRDSVYLEMISELHREISRHIFSSILNPFMVGFNEDFGQHLYQLDKLIHGTCKLPHISDVLSLSLTRLGPSHVWQHWRSATSNASASLSRRQIDADCDRIVRIVEYRFAHHSRTDLGTRTQELKALLGQSIEFKQRLECQGYFYYFWWSPPNRPFRPEHMASLTAEDASDEVVESSVWPMLFKAVPEGEVIVQKELVRTTPRHAHDTSDGICSRGEIDIDS